ncbi:MAG: DsbE family thiol:disulfide interchange protein [Gammaproteobacteria bacterium]|nr:DsbE family thiol:disulfide interchange protein [Gammaproteobacteria bacterium]
MNRYLLPLGVFVLLALVLGIGIRHAPEKGVIASPLLGKPAPQFSLPALTQPTQLVRSAELRGHWYLLNVWGTWCHECRAEHDTLLWVQRSGVVPLIGLDWKDDEREARAWLAQLGNPYQAVAVDTSGRVAIDWGVYGAPETFLVDPRGIVVYKHVGPLTEKIWSQEILPRLSAARTGKS